MPISRGRPAARAGWVIFFVLAIGALLAFCGHPGRQSAQRLGPNGEAPSWALQYVHFATPSDGWAMAEDEQTGNAELLTTHDGGRHWHQVTPNVVVAARTPLTVPPAAPLSKTMTRQRWWRHPRWAP